VLGQLAAGRVRCKVTGWKRCDGDLQTVAAEAMGRLLGGQDHGG
jgi:hypothetical protein